MARSRCRREAPRKASI
ncbi:UNVERIFIED_CONTAM: hypothetical protein GTU68_008753 [Idotea baltica]|nr:hypothetical protein [Idotea baltica]